MKYFFSRNISSNSVNYIKHLFFMRSTLIFFNWNAHRVNKAKTLTLLTLVYETNETYLSGNDFLGIRKKHAVKQVNIKKK